MLEGIANLPLHWVAVIVAVLLLGRWRLLKSRNRLAKEAGEFCESLAIAGALVFFLIRPFIVQAFFIPSESMLPTLRVSDHLLVNKFLYRFREPRRGDIVVFRAPAKASPDGKSRDFIKRVIAVPGDKVRIVPGRVIVNGSALSHWEIRGDLADLIEPGGAGAVKFVRNGVAVDGKSLTRAELAARLGVEERSVRIVPGRVYINGKAIDEPYTAEDPDVEYPIISGRLATPLEWLSASPTGERVTRVPKGRLLVMGDNRNNSNDSRFWGLLDRRRVLGKAFFSFWPLGRIGIVR